MRTYNTFSTNSDTRLTEPLLDSDVRFHPEPPPPSPSSAFNEFNKKFVQWTAARKSLFIILLSPFIGAVIFAFASTVESRTFLMASRSDAAMLKIIGFAFQLAIVVPLIHLVFADDAFHSLVSLLDSSADYYAPLVVYPISVIYYCSMSIVFLHFKSLRREVDTTDRVRLKTADQVVEGMIINELSESTATINALWLVPISMVLGAAQTLTLRVCSWSGSKPCVGATFSFSIPFFYKNKYFVIVTIFWFLIWSTLMMSCLFALLVSFQMLRQHEAFIYSDTEYSATLALLVKDLTRPANLQMWVNLSRRFVQDQRSHPLSQAVTGPTAFNVFLTFFGAVSYVVMDNVAKSNGVAELTVGCVSAAIFALTCALSFTRITVRMQRVVDYQITYVSTIQTRVQVQLDDTSRDEPEKMKKFVRAKVRMYQALDTYMRLAEGPTIVGMSLNSARWAALLVGMFFLNVGFGVLFVQHCRD